MADKLPNSQKMGQKMESVLGDNSTKFISWYNTLYSGNVKIGDEWSSILVGWCAEQLSISKEIIPVLPTAKMLYDFYTEKDMVTPLTEGYAPPTGTLMFGSFDSPDGGINFVGVVSYSTVDESTGKVSISVIGGPVKPRTGHITVTDIVTIKLIQPWDNVYGLVIPDYEGTSLSQESEESIEDTGIVEEEVTSLEYTQIRDEYEVLPALGSQPYYAFVDLYIGGHAFPDIPPQYLVSMTVTKLMQDGVSEISLVLYDKYSDEIEELLHRGALSDDTYIRFGHTSGRQSRLLKFKILNYNIDFSSEGSLLTINAQTEAATSANIEGSQAFSAGTTPSDAVKALCDRMDLYYTDETIHECKQLIGSDGEPVSFNVIREEDYIDYIKSELCPRAVRLDGVSGYQFYIDDTQIPNVAHFHPIDITPNVLKTYVYQKGVNSNVISLSVNTNFVLSGEGADSTTSRLETVNIDSITKEETSHVKDINDVNGNVSGEYSHIKSDQSTKLVDTGAMSYGEAVAQLDHRMTITQKAFEVDLTIVGDPTVVLGQLIRVVVLTSKNKLHHVSGIYMVNNLSLSIQDGIMMSSLNLTRNTDLYDGIELLNYNKLYK